MSEKVQRVNPRKAVRQVWRHVMGTSAHEAMNAVIAHINHLEVQATEALTLQARLAACEADARRYRWLRVRWGRVGEQYDGATSRMVAIGDDPEGWEVDPESLDAAIDSAISAGGE